MTEPAMVTLSFPDHWGGTVGAVVDGESVNFAAQGEVQVPLGASTMVQLFHPAPEVLLGLPAELGEQPFSKALHALGGSDATLRAVASLAWVTTINVVGVISEVDAARFTGIFERDVLAGGELLTDAALDAVAERVDVLAVQLGGSAITDDGLAKLGALTELQELGLRSSVVTGSGLAALAGLESLASIMVTGEHVTWDSIPALPHVTSLIVAGPNAMKGVGPDVAARFPALKSVSVFLDDQVAHAEGEDLWTLRDAFPGVEVNGQTFTAKALQKLRDRRSVS